MLYTVVPMGFLLAMTLWAMTQQVVFEWSGLGPIDANGLLFVLGAIILGFTGWILIEVVNLLRRVKDEPSQGILTEG